MAWGFVRSCCASSSTGVITASSSPSPQYPVSNVLICLMILLLLTIFSPISAVAYDIDDQQSEGGGGGVAAAAGDMIMIPSDLVDLSCARTGPPRHHHRAVLRGQQPAGDDEQESKKLPPPAEQGAIPPPSSTVQAEGSSEGQQNCRYDVYVRTSCSSSPRLSVDEVVVEIALRDASGREVYVPSSQRGNKFAPCKVDKLTRIGQCLERVCQVQLFYGGTLGSWIPNYVKVFSAGRMNTFCIGSGVGWGNIFGACTAPARTDDEYNSCG